MAIPDTHRGLLEAGYRYEGHSPCRACGEEMYWYITPKGKKEPMSVVAGSIEKGSPRCESHFASCPRANEFRKKRKGGT